MNLNFTQKALGVFVIVLLLAVSIFGSSRKKPPVQADNPISPTTVIAPSVSEPSQEPTAEQVAISKTEQSTPAYRLYEDNKTVKLIVVDAKDVNESSMIALGLKLKESYSSDSIVRVSVYDEENAAALFKKALTDSMSSGEEVIYDKHYIGQYNKNTNTGLNEYEIHLAGLNGSSKTIRY